jgi:hypothetical protein
MNASEEQADLSRKSVPELIKHLWDLHFAMALDPALASSAAHVKEAALTLEHIRRIAFEISQEEKQRKQRRAPKSKQCQKDTANLNWLRAAKAGSDLKH